jgi:hypothetical protein
MGAGDRKYLFVDGGLHSFAEEIGRFTKTSGFHYRVYLHPPRIVHHLGSWRVEPWGDGSFVVNNAVWIYKDHVEDKRGRRYEGLRVPFNATYAAEELYDEIVNAILKYALACFLGSSRADHEVITVRISFSKKPLEPVPIGSTAQLKLLRGLGEPRYYHFLQEIGVPKKYVVTLHPPRIFSREDPSWGWEVKPCCGLFVLNERYTFGPRHVIDEKTNEWYDGIRLVTEDVYYPASSVYERVLEAVAKYALVRFLGRQAKEFDGKEVVISFESTH